MEQWILYNKKAEFNTIATKLGIDPLLVKIMRNRNLTTKEEMASFLQLTMPPDYSPMQMKDMDKAVQQIKSAINNKEKIRIISDYDVDGVMSNYILFKAFVRLNARVDYVIPDRIKDGYGLNSKLIDEAKNQAIDLIVTCDNGIAAIEEITYANSLGIKVVVTDHHEVPFTMEEDKKSYHLPQALAVVDNKQVDCPYPYKQLCGASVAFKLVQALYAEFGIEEKELEEFYVYMAIATVCDVVELKDENRAIVKRGLAYLKKNEDIGLNALIEANNLVKEQIKEYHFGFIIGPCINAGGRLETAQMALELFLEENKQEAKRKAIELTNLNHTRKNMTLQGVEKAMKIVQSEKYCKDKVLVVYLPECHESLAGIIAGRVRENTGKPTFILTDGKEGLKGSGRSIEQYSMYEEMSKVADVFVKFGGHPMAAGFSIQTKNLEKMRKRLNEETSLQDKDFVTKRYIDAAMPFSYITEALIEELSQLAPFGKDNEKPAFAVKNATILKANILGAAKNVLKLTIEQQGTVLQGIRFGEVKPFLEELEKRVPSSEYRKLLDGQEVAISAAILYYPEINEYMGRKSIQLKLLSVK